MTRIGVNGAGGRMGRRILALAASMPKSFEIVGAFEHEASGLRGHEIDLENGKKIKIESLTGDTLKGEGVLIDFSGPTGTATAILKAQKAGWGLVIGTTGLDEKTVAGSIKPSSKKIPIVFSSNMSVGVNLILELVEEAARKLSLDFDIEITEAHHRHKKDSPSGTALSLAKAVVKGKKWDLKKVLKFRGEGKVSEDRSREEIGMQVIRAGEIVGDHTVRFEGPAETIEITHRAHSRDTFARGALLAARFAAKRKPGLYTMADVLNEKV